jgi:thiosulfate/3-mercaptopyruvate sulfurtransferase
LEPWEKVFVDAEAFLETVHGKMTCTECHNGQQAQDKETAHTDLISVPSLETDVCTTCHANVAETFENSLHRTQAGYWTAIDARSVPENHPPLEEMFGNHCASCHTSCGDCHVSQPRSVGGGFIEGHLFKESPSMTRNCTACHGSRVGNEYMGKNEDVLADVHFRQGRMKCSDCHTGSEMHGEYMAVSEEPVEHRYDGGQIPACTDCHPQVGSAGDPIEMHTTHGEKLSCQVCHSTTYTSCDGCHVAVSEKTGNPFFRTEDTYSTFVIGKNPLQDESRPYDYVPLRHIPVAPTSYEYYGENLLPNFDNLPTWAYATPHNIQRNTPQTESCEACHGNPEIFLTEDKIAEGEMNANLSVMVAQVPPPVGEISSSNGLPLSHFGFTACIYCHESGGNVPLLPENHAGYMEGQCVQCHTIPAQTQ